MNIKIDIPGGVPIYIQGVERVKHMIATGSSSPGTNCRLCGNWRRNQIAPATYILWGQRGLPGHLARQP